MTKRTHLIFLSDVLLDCTADITDIPPFSPKEFSDKSSSYNKNILHVCTWFGSMFTQQTPSFTHYFLIQPNLS